MVVGERRLSRRPGSRWNLMTAAKEMGDWCRTQPSADSGVEFTPVGPVELKGIGGPVVLHAASRRSVAAHPP
jgi:hypothetical protein